MSGPLSIYLDTSVLMHYLKNYNPGLTTRARIFMNKIESGDYNGIVSDFCLMELMRAIRIGCVQNEHKMNPVDWDNEFSHAMNIIYRLKNMRIIKEASFGSGYGRQCYLHQLIDEITRIMRHYKGKAVDLRGNPTKQVHDGLGSPDCIHVFLARRYGCDKIATFDHDFEESRPDIVPLLLYKEY